MKRYIIHPGKIQSKNDGEIHFIGFRRLVDLYHIDPSECIDASITHQSLWPKDARHLYPNCDGNYTL